jgi:hypothetical protein
MYGNFTRIGCVPPSRNGAGTIVWIVLQSTAEALVYVEAEGGAGLSHRAEVDTRAE